MEINLKIDELILEQEEKKNVTALKKVKIESLKTRGGKNIEFKGDGLLIPGLSQPILSMVLRFYDGTDSNGNKKYLEKKYKVSVTKNKNLKIENI